MEISTVARRAEPLTDQELVEELMRRHGLPTHREDNATTGTVLAAHAGTYGKLKVCPGIDGIYRYDFEFDTEGRWIALEAW